MLLLLRIPRVPWRNSDTNQPHRDALGGWTPHRTKLPRWLSGPLTATDSPCLPEGGFSSPGSWRCPANLKHFDRHCVTVLSVPCGLALLPSLWWLLFGTVISYKWHDLKSHPGSPVPLNIKKKSYPLDLFFILLHLCSNVLYFYAWDRKSVV